MNLPMPVLERNLSQLDKLFTYSQIRYNFQSGYILIVPTAFLSVCTRIQSHLFTAKNEKKKQNL